MKCQRLLNFSSVSGSSLLKLWLGCGHLFVVCLLAASRQLSTETAYKVCGITGLTIDVTAKSAVAPCGSKWYTCRSGHNSTSADTSLTQYLDIFGHKVLLQLAYQPISFRPTHSIIHVQQHAVVIVQDCTGVCLRWVKTLLLSEALLWVLKQGRKAV